MDNREIRTQGWSLIRKRLEDKGAAATSPVTVVAVNPAFTSQKCSSCGHIDKNNRKNQAEFKCLACGYSNNADVNAAINILAAGQAVAAHGGTLQKEPDEVRTQPTLVAA